MQVKASSATLEKVASVGESKEDDEEEEEEEMGRGSKDEEHAHGGTVRGKVGGRQGHAPQPYRLPGMAQRPETHLEGACGSW